MRIIAKLDVKYPYVVKPVHFEGLRKVGSPAELAQKYYQNGADEIFYMDIVASLYQRGIQHHDIQSATKGVFVPFAVGGGIRNIDDMSKLFHNGADKIVINTHALQREPGLIDQAAHIFGAQAVVLNVEAKRWDDWWECFSDCGRERSGKDVLKWIKEAESRGAGEILIQSVDNDGRRNGFDIDLIREVKNTVRIPVVAASGAGSIEDIERLAQLAKPDAIALASVLHYDLCDIQAIKARLAIMNSEVCDGM